MSRHYLIILGSLVAVSGVDVMAMGLLPNPFWGRMIFVFCGVIVLGVGLLLTKAVDNKVNELADHKTVKQG